VSWHGPSTSTYATRTDADYQRIADIIKTDLDAKLLGLSELNGHDDGTSDELNRLVSHLGGGWTYNLGSTGGSQRVRRHSLGRCLPPIASGPSSRRGDAGWPGGAGRCESRPAPVSRH
jgi:hypothetical protein